MREMSPYSIPNWGQGGDSSAGTQALPVGKIIETKVCRKDNPKVSQICIC